MWPCTRLFVFAVLVAIAEDKLLWNQSPQVGSPVGRVCIRTGRQSS